MYTKYGSNHKDAQKTVFDLEKDPLDKAFFTVSGRVVRQLSLRSTECTPGVVRQPGGRVV